MHNKVIKVLETSHDESMETLTFTFMFQHLSRGTDMSTLNKAVFTNQTFPQFRSISGPIIHTKLIIFLYGTRWHHIF